MDASKALSALTSGKLVDMVNALEWDDRLDFNSPDGTPYVLARRGATLLSITSDGRVTMIPHADAEQASACFADKRDQVEQMLTFVGVLREAHAAYVSTTTQVPDDVSSLLDGSV